VTKIKCLKSKLEQEGMHVTYVRPDPFIIYSYVTMRNSTLSAVFYQFWRSPKWN